MKRRFLLLFIPLCCAGLLSGSNPADCSRYFDPMIVWNTLPSNQELGLQMEISDLYRYLEAAERDLMFAREKLKLYSGPTISGLELTAEDRKRDEQKIKELEEKIESLKGEIQQKEREFELLKSDHEKYEKEQQTGQKDDSEAVQEDVPDDEEMDEEAEDTVETVAHISYIYGIVDVKRAGTEEWVQANQMLALEPGDIVRTRRRSKVEISFGDRYIVCLQPGTEMKIPTEYKRKEDTFINRTLESLKLFFGFIYVNGREIEGELNVHTPRAVLGVRGTTFSVDSRADDTTRVVVLDGTVEVQPNDTPSGKTILQKNMACVVHPDGTMEVSYLSDDDQDHEISTYQVFAGQDEQKLVNEFQQLEVGDLTVEQQLSQYQAFLKHPDVDEATALIVEFMQWVSSITQEKDGRVTLLALLENMKDLQAYNGRFPSALAKVKKAPTEGMAGKDMKRVWEQTLMDYADSTRLLISAASRFDSEAFHRGGELLGYANRHFIDFNTEIGEKMKSP